MQPQQLQRVGESNPETRYGPVSQNALKETQKCKLEDRVVGDTRCVPCWERETIPYHLVVPVQAVTRGGVKPKSKIS